MDKGLKNEVLVLTTDEDMERYLEESFLKEGGFARAEIDSKYIFDLTGVNASSLKLKTLLNNIKRGGVTNILGTSSPRYLTNSITSPVFLASSRAFSLIRDVSFRKLKFHQNCIFF